MSQFVLGKYRFQTKEEYEKAKAEHEIIRELRSKMDLDSFEDVKTVYNKLSSGELSFTSSLGRDFDDEIFEKYEKLKNTSSKIDKSSKKNTALKNQTVKISRLEDFDSDMQQQIIKEINKRERTRKIIIFSCFTVMFCCAGYLLYYQYMASRVQREVEKLALIREEMQENSSPPVSNERNEEPEHYYANITTNQDNEVPDVLPLYEELYNQNKSLIGWLKIADTIIDYPVMQTQNNEYYLDHNFHQKYDKNGSIFLDAECDIFPRSDNLILYGHHMKSGKMFGSLWKYEDKNYYLKHKHIEFDTIYETGIYEIMYVFRDRVYSKEDVNFKYYEFLNANSATEFDSYMNEMAAMSYYDTGVVAEYGDKLLTLSTCDYEQNNGRFVVVARKITNN